MRVELLLPPLYRRKTETHSFKQLSHPQVNSFSKITKKVYHMYLEIKNSLVKEKQIIRKL